MNKTIFVLMVFVVLMADFNKKRFPHNFYSFTKRVYQQTKVVDKKHNLYANPHIEHSSDTPSAVQYDHRRSECAHGDDDENSPSLLVSDLRCC